MSECPHYTDVGTCRVRGEPVVQGEQKRCQTPLGMRLCYDYQRARAEAAEAEVARLEQERDAWREWAYRLAGDVELAAMGKLGDAAAREGDAFSSSPLVIQDCIDSDDRAIKAWARAQSESTTQGEPEEAP